jgi:hypothetical protein
MLFFVDSCVYSFPISDSSILCQMNPKQQGMEKNQ